MKKLSLLVAIVMLFSCLGLSSLAEGFDQAPAEGAPAGDEGFGSSDGAPAGDEGFGGSEGAPGGDGEFTAAQAGVAEDAVEDYDPYSLVVSYIDADGTQVKLGYVEGVTAILDVDGLKFKDLNSNGELDVYEDWRLDTEARVADLLAKLTPAEKAAFLIQTDMPAAVGTAENESTETVYYYTTVYGISHMLDNNGSGDPAAMSRRHNGGQAAAESTAYGIPITVTSDRQYDAWAGYVDTAHNAVGTANDVELETAILSQYAKESAASGIHVTLQPFGVEIGSWYGENPEYIAKLTEAEVNAYQSNGVFTCVKHFIDRSGFDPNTIAGNIENYMYTWQVAINAGTRWIMSNSAGKGLDGLNVDFSRESLAYLRDTLGYDGVLVTDWGSIGYAAKGIDADGIDLATLSNPERYAYEINIGVDQLGINRATTDPAKGSGSCYVMGDMIEAVETGLIAPERVDEAVARLLRTKFDLGLFENPYTDPDKALEIAASAEYIAEPWEIVDNETLAAARNQELVELERKLEAESAVLLKNDGNLLPLSADKKVYIDSTRNASVPEYKKYIGEFAAVVDTMEEADVIIADITVINDAAELLIEDALEAGKDIVILANCVLPNAWILESATAAMYLPYDRTPDHGVAKDGIFFSTEPVVLAELLYGVREPAGMLVAEITRDEAMDADQWPDLAGDQGTSLDVRMLLEALMLANDDHSVPNNYGDPLLQYQYGMRYGEEASFRYTSFIAPTELKTVRVNLFLDFWAEQTVTEIATQKSGEPFTVYCILWNDGGDGITTVDVYDGDQVILSKIMAVTGESWRVMKLDLTLEGAGEHTVTIGGLTRVIPVE